MPVPDAGEALLIPDWPAPGEVQARVTTRLLPGVSRPPFDAFNLGLRAGEDAATVQINRRLLHRALTLPAPPRWLRQVHGNVVHHCGREAASGEPEADAAITRERGVVLAVLTADCLPVLLAARDGSVVGAAHAGWRGLAAGVLEATVRAMGHPPAAILAWLGPAIGAGSYEVGEEVREAFTAADAAAAGAFSPARPGHWHCDLYALARRRLAATGVRAVHGGGFDTRADPRFYSWRAAQPTGRFASLIWRGAAPPASVLAFPAHAHA